MTRADSADTAQLVAHSRSCRSVSMRKSLMTWKQSVLMLLEHSRRTRMLVGVFNSKPKRTSKLLHPSPLCGKLTGGGGGGGGDECTGN